MPYKDKEKRKAYRKVWALKRKTEKKEWLNEYKKDQPCAHCRKLFPPILLDLHHVDPADKKDSIASLVHGSSNLKTIQEEVKKCIILCVSCHRLHHHHKKQ